MVKTKVTNELDLPEKKVSLPDYGVWIESRASRPDYGTSGHTHDHFSLIYVVSGKGRVAFKDKQYVLSPNTVIPLMRHQVHQIIEQPRKSMTVFSLYFDALEMNSYITDYLFIDSIPFSLPVYYAELVKRNLRQMLYEQGHNPPGYKIGIRHCLNLTLLHLFRARLQLTKQSTSPGDRNSTQRVMAALDYITENCHEQYTLSDGAKMANVSQRQFTNLCRKLNGKSFVQFLNAYRCGRAGELLKNTDLSISAIAFEIGFEELSSFYRAFRKHKNCSPSRYRS
jgi:AraC-like DNA-binding protein